MNESNQIPTLYMLIGLPGSGKSEWAKERASVLNATVFSSDAIRKELYGDEDVQDDPARVFNLLHERIIECLKAGNSAIYDATNMVAKRRKAFLEMLNKVSCTKTALVMAVPYEVCVERAQARERGVSSKIIHKFRCQYEPPTPGEGFDEIYVMQDPAFNGYYGTADEVVERADKMDHDSEYHTYTVGRHMMESLDYFDKQVCPRLIDEGKYAIPTINVLRYAVYLHDIGKYNTKSFKNMKGETTKNAHYYGHEHVGAYDVMFIDTPQNDIVSLLIALHMKPYISWHDSAAAKEKDIKLYGPEIIDLVEILHECDLAAH